MHTWSRADLNTCGSAPMSCPLRDGSTATMGVADCIHEPIRAAIAALGAGSRSRNLRLCVSPARPGLRHARGHEQGLANTDPAEAADYLATIMDWVHTRLGDP